MYPDQLQEIRNDIAAKLRIMASLVEQSGYSEPLYQTAVMFRSLIENEDRKEMMRLEDAVMGCLGDDRVTDFFVKAIEAKDIEAGDDPENIRLARMVAEWAERLRDVPYRHPVMALAGMVGRFAESLDNETNLEFHSEISNPEQDRIVFPEPRFNEADFHAKFNKDLAKLEDAESRANSRKEKRKAKPAS
jgi:hypothetical protein